MKYVGDGFTVDSPSFVVEREGVPVDLEPQAMDLLLYMVERRDELLTKAELLDNVWGDQFVGDSALATRIKQVRQALGDDGRAQRVIKTVHGRGYRFIAEVREVPTEAEVLDLTEPQADARGRVLHNIAPARTELIGRTQLLTDIAEAVVDTRLVSLIGLGGAGKTSLAQAVGRRLVDDHTGDFGDGVWFADLIPVEDGEGIDAAVARAVGIQQAPGASRADLLATVAERRMLIVIDNCEHIIDAAAAFCSDLLDSTVAPHLLTTSREPLRVLGEHRMAVGPLPVIADDGGAIDLLDSVARRYGTTIPDHDRVAALELCTRVDGLPLAIELVGARLGLMSASELLDRLETATDSGDRRPDRHANLATILGDTLATMAADDVRLLTLLSRVQGGFDIGDVERLADHGGIADATGSFVSLADRSLVITTASTQRRHSVLETVRQYTSTQDLDPTATGDAHAAWCLDSVGTTLEDHYYDLRRGDWVLGHYPDVTVAERHLVGAGRADTAAELAAATGLAMHLDDGSRAAQMLTRIDSHATHVVEAPLAARLHCSGVMAAMAARAHMGMYEHGLAAVEAADQTDDVSLQGLARIMRSWAGVVIDADQARADVDDALALAESVGDQATALLAIGYKIFHLAMGLRFDEAVEVGFAALNRRHAPASYPRRVVGTGLICCLVIDDPKTALAVDARVRTSVPSAGFWGLAVVRTAALAALGDIAAMRDSVDELVTRLHRAGVSPLPDLLLAPAALANKIGDTDRAGRYLGAVRACPHPTQSLMSSTAYRAMRCHIEPAAPDDLAASTEQIWAEAQSWLQEVEL